MWNATGLEQRQRVLALEIKFGSENKTSTEKGNTGIKLLYLGEL